MEKHLVSGTRRSPCAHVGACLFLCCVLVASTAPSAVLAAADPVLTKEQQKRLQERDRLVEEVVRLWRAGKLEETIQTLEKVLAVEREVFGEVHEELAGTWDGLASVQRQRGDLASAQTALEKVLEIRQKLHGKGHWKVTDARLDLEELKQERKLDLPMRRQLDQARRLMAEVSTLKKERKYGEAIRRAGQALQIFKEVLGQKHRSYAQGLHNLAVLYHDLRDYARAEPLYQQALAIRKEILGDKHPSYAISLNSLAALYRAQEDYARAEPLYKQALAIIRELLGEKHPSYATGLNSLAALYYTQGDYARALLLFRQALAIRKEVLGEKHPDYAASLNNLALLYKVQGDYARAEPLFQESLQIKNEVLGEQHPDYATGLDNLASLYQAEGDYARAEPLFQQALRIRKEVLGEKHPDYATSLNNLALLYQDRGDYARAEPLYQQALAILKDVPGEKHPSYATGLNNLAVLYQIQGDYPRAEPLFRQALEITRKALGEKHPDYATSLTNLALLYRRDMEDHARAEPLYRQALQIRKEMLGEKHPAYANSLTNLALLYQAQEEYARAEPLFRQALEIQKETLGEKHPDYATSLNNLALLYLVRGEQTKAGPLLEQALAIRKAVLGEKHPDYATSLMNVGALLLDRGQAAEAFRLARRGVAIMAGHLSRTAAIQSPRQQLLLLQKSRPHLDLLLSAAAQVREGVHDEVLAWKGAVAARQSLLRLSQEAGQGPQQQRTRRLAADLLQATRRLAALNRSTPTPEKVADYRSKVEDLSNEVEKLERQLASLSSAYRSQREQARRTSADIQKVLPAGTVLVDLLEYYHYQPRQEGEKSGRWERHLAAFVVHPAGPVQRVDLGSVAPIRAAVAPWRKEYGWQQGEGSPGQRLRRLVWKPLVPHLKGAHTVLLSPDGVLAQVPFAALPGNKPDSYLLEEVALAVVPVPQLLPEILTARATSTEPSLLLLGDVDYQALPGREDTLVASSSTAPGERSGWSPLEGTRVEILSVRSSFKVRYPEGAVRLLPRGQATEEAVRQQAGRHRYLHLATHGFFAAPQLRSALAPGEKPGQAELVAARAQAEGFHPGLLSGIVLAGAGQPPQPDRDDGILTALEVEALDLSGVELVTLSACETGLGQTAGGEGVLGLQRAFQMAGARTTLCSLWKVSDRATMALMQRFYANHWQKGMGKLQAFREAQLWLLREAGAEPGATRGFELVEAQPAEKGKRLPPYYWAAFVLSGDWR